MFNVKKFLLLKDYNARSRAARVGAIIALLGL